MKCPVCERSLGDSTLTPEKVYNVEFMDVCSDCKIEIHITGYGAIERKAKEVEQEVARYMAGRYSIMTGNGQNE